MKDLKLYLVDAKDYLGGDGAERVRKYFQTHESEMEVAWKDLTSSYGRSNEFYMLVEKYGLYILVEDGCPWKPLPAFARRDKKTKFELRILNFGFHKVAVLKCSYLPAAY